MRDWIDSAQDSDYWRALVNAALNLRVHTQGSQYYAGKVDTDARMVTRETAR